MTNDDRILLLGDPRGSLLAPIREAVGPASNGRVEPCAGLDKAVAEVRGGRVGLVIAHVGGSGIQESEAVRLMQAIQLAELPVATVLVGEADDAAQALRMLRQGAAGYLSQPLNLGRLRLLVDLLTIWRRFSAAPPPAAAPEITCIGDDFVFASPVMKALLDQVRLAAPLSSTVLLTGETGTGKTRLAKLIHELSPRREKPLVVVNCGGLSPTLVESEMFGHARGSFTGADRDREGKFAQAGDGTLLLDDVDALPASAQAKLLRAVDERVFEPVGSNRTQPVRARLIVATNRSLEDAVAQGRFRSDLYYRINVITFHLPPLRERPEMIRHIATKFLADFATAGGRPVGGFSQQALAALEAFDWPGNMRELRNVVERGVALSPGPVIELKDLPEPIQRVFRDSVPVFSPLVNALAESRRAAELQRLAAALARHNNNRSLAAKELGVSRTTLYKKLAAHGL